MLRFFPSLKNSLFSVFSVRLGALLLLAMLSLPSMAQSGWQTGFEAANGFSSGIVRALAVDSVGNVYVGGSFNTVDGVTVNNIARWDGESWSALGSGVSNPVEALAIDSEDNLYVGGFFELAGELQVNHIARWDGASWSALDGGVALNGFVVVAPGFPSEPLLGLIQ